MYFFFPPNNLFFHYALILSEIDVCFSPWGKQVEKREFLSHEKKKKKSPSSRFFKVPWQQSIQNNFDENSRQREADYKENNVLLSLQELQR